jgi:hypothetical protein
MIPNKYQYGLSKYMQQFLVNRYPQNKDIIERIGHNLVTEQDFTDFMKLIVDVYEVAYLKAVDQHKVCLEKLGIKMEITQPKDG